MNKLYNIIVSWIDEGKKPKKLTFNEMQILTYCVWIDLVKNGKSKFMYSNIAELLEHCGITVIMDYHKVNYIASVEGR